MKKPRHRNAGATFKLKLLRSPLQRRDSASHRDAPNDPGIGDRPGARVMTPVEAPMLQPSMGLDPDRFSLLKKPLR